MPGARYDGDLIIQLRGNKDLGRQYVPEARKVMGFVLQDAEANGLGVHQVKRYTADGTEIVAEKIGDLKRVTITPPGGPGRNKPVRIFKDLVLGYIDRTASDDANINVSPVILSPDEELDWRAFFYNDEEPGFYEGAGSYSDVFPRANDLTQRRQLPSANTHWYDADGRYCAWLSAVNHFCPPTRHPDNLYGFRVVALGRNIIDMRTYEFGTASYNNHRVLSACIRGNALYVVASALGQLFFTPRPAVAPLGDAWGSEKFAEDALDYALLRFPLSEATDEVTGQLYYRAAPEAEQVLWEGSLERAYGAWRFSQDGRRCANVQLPTGGFLFFKMEAPSSTVTNDSVIHELLISEDGSSASLGTYSADNVIYDDGDATLELEYVGAAALDFVCGSYRWPAIRSTADALTGRRMVYADPRNGRFFMQERDLRDATVAPLDSSSVFLEVTERDIVFEDGAETYIYENTGPRLTGRRPNMDVVESYTVFGYSLVFAQLTVGGIGGYYAGAVGVVDWASDNDTVAWPGFLYADMAFMDTSLIAQSYYYVNAFGMANGGMSLSRHRVFDPPTTPIWNQAIGYGDGNSIEPQYTVQPSVLVNMAGVSNDRYMFVQSNASMYFTMTSGHPRWSARPTYLTGGDVPTLISVAEDYSYMIDCYTLGKPLKAQKYSLPVRTP